MFFKIFLNKSYRKNYEAAKANTQKAKQKLRTYKPFRCTEQTFSLSGQIYSRRKKKTDIN